MSCLPRLTHAIWVVAILAGSLVVFDLRYQPALLSRQGSSSQHAVVDFYKLAREQSDGFFDDVHEDHWRLLRERVRTRKNHCVGRKDCLDKQTRPGDRTLYYLDNFEPDFTCMHERRIGGKFGLGDGPKWVCDPHRIARKRDCLVYSVGSHGNFLFEEAVRSHISEGCEVHTFDPGRGPANYSRVAPSFVHYHDWGLRHSPKENSTKFKSMRRTVELLGHVGRTIDIFKIDCEGCEFTCYQDWLDGGVVLRQILVEVHNANDHAVTSSFFEAHQRNGYVTFHKEPNIATYGTCIEYAFLKLGDSFFDGMEFQNADDAGVNLELVNPKRGNLSKHGVR